MRLNQLLRRSLAAVLLGGLVAWSPAAAGASEADPKAREAELKRKSEEIEKLKRDLADREAELNRLKKDNEKLRSEQAAPPKPAAAPSAQPAPAGVAPATPVVAPLAQPSRPLNELPEIQPDTLVDVRDLILYYRGDPAAADQRFKGRTFRVQGIVGRFHTALFIRTYKVFLDAPDRLMDASFVFGYRPEWKTVVTDDKGRELTATMERSRMSLLKLGQPVIIRAKCKGLDGAVVEFSESRIIP